MDNTRIIDQLQQDSEDGLTEIFRLYNRRLLYFALQYLKNKEVAEDIVADCFIKLWQRRKQFHTLDNIRAFLYISVKNACLNHLRKPDTVSLDALEGAESLLYEDTDVFGKIVRTELVKRIYEEVTKLPEKQRDVFTMTYIDDLSVGEISEKLGISPTSVYTNRSRALASLKHMLNLKDAFCVLLLIAPLIHP